MFLNCIFDHTFVLFRILIKPKIFLSVGPWIGRDEWDCRLMASKTVIFYYAGVEVKGGGHLRNDQIGQC